MTPALKDAFLTVAARLRDPMLDMHPSSLGGALIAAYPSGSVSEILRQARQALGLEQVPSSLWTWAKDKTREEVAAVLEALAREE